MHIRNISIAASLLWLPSVGHAQIIRANIPGCDFVTGRMTAACIPNFIASLVDFVFGLIGIFFILNIMYAGYQIALAGAQAAEDGAGKERLKWSIIGFIITISSFAILNAAYSIFMGP